MFAGCDDVPARAAGEREGKAGEDDDGLDDVAPFDVCEGVILGGGDGEEGFEELFAGFETPGEGYGVEVAGVLVWDGAEEGEVVAEDVDG